MRGDKIGKAASGTKARAVGGVPIPCAEKKEREPPPEAFGPHSLKDKPLFFLCQAESSACFRRI